MQHMANATLVINGKVFVGRWIVRRGVWVLPQASAERPHGLK
jgi:hypothetical protein